MTSPPRRVNAAYARVIDHRAVEEWPAFHDPASTSSRPRRTWSAPGRRLIYAIRAACWRTASPRCARSTSTNANATATRRPAACSASTTRAAGRTPFLICHHARGRHGRLRHRLLPRQGPARRRVPYAFAERIVICDSRASTRWSRFRSDDLSRSATSRSAYAHSNARLIMMRVEPASDDRRATEDWQRGSAATSPRPDRRPACRAVGGPPPRGVDPAISTFERATRDGQSLRQQLLDHGELLSTLRSSSTLAQHGDLLALGELLHPPQRVVFLIVYRRGLPTPAGFEGALFHGNTDLGFGPRSQLVPEVCAASCPPAFSSKNSTSSSWNGTSRTNLGQCRTHRQNRFQRYETVASSQTRDGIGRIESRITRRREASCRQRFISRQTVSWTVRRRAGELQRKRRGASKPTRSSTARRSSTTQPDADTIAPSPRSTPSARASSTRRDRRPQRSGRNY